MARVIIMLSGDSPMLSVLLFWSHQCFRNIINNIVTTNTVGSQYDEMKKYSREVTGLLSVAIEHNAVPTIASFLIHLVNRIENLHHSRNRPTPPVNEIPNSYVLKKRVAYYFTESGKPVEENAWVWRTWRLKESWWPTRSWPWIHKKLAWCFVWRLWISFSCGFCPIHG